MKMGHKIPKNIKKINIFRLFFGMIPNDIPRNLFFPGLEDSIDEESNDLKNEIYKLFTTFEKKAKQYYGDKKDISNNGLIMVNDISNKGNTPDYIYGKGLEPIEYNDFKYTKQLRLMGIENPLMYLIFMYNTFLIFKPLLLDLYNNKKYRYITSTSNSSILENGNIINSDEYDPEEMFGHVSDISEQLYYYYKDMIANDNNNFKKNNIQESLIEKEYPCYMTLDIQSFFPSIYTHNLSGMQFSLLFQSIENSYDDDGESLIKEYFNFLDIYNRRSNRDETRGIIVGPLSSKIASELFSLSIYYGAYNNNKLHDLFKSVRYTRYMDDVVVFSMHLNILHELHSKLEKFLQKYRLSFQDKKVSMQQGIYVPKGSNFLSISNNVPFLHGNKIYDHKIAIKNINDFLNFKQYVKRLMLNKNVPTVRAMFTILGKKRINFPSFNAFYNKESFERIFIRFIIRITITYPYLASKSYKLIENQIKQNDVETYSFSKDVKTFSYNYKYDHVIYEELKNSLNIINKDFSDTVLQIWTYYLLNLLLDKYKESDIQFYNNRSNLLNDYVQGNNSLNPLVIMGFISRSNNNAFNKKIFKIIFDNYKRCVKNRKYNTDKQPKDICDTILNSKWGFSIYKLYSVCNFNNKQMVKIFLGKNTPKDGKIHKQAEFFSIILSNLSKILK